MYPLNSGTLMVVPISHLETHGGNPSWVSLHSLHYDFHGLRPFWNQGDLPYGNAIALHC